MGKTLKAGWRWFRRRSTRVQALTWLVVGVVVVVALATPPGEETQTGESRTTTRSTTSESDPTPATTAATETQEAPPADPGYVSRGTMGDEWPLTVDEGRLRCDGSAAAGAVFFEADGRWYPVNGIASGRSEGIEIDSIWADDPDIPGAKKDIGVLIQRGLALCD